VKPRRETDKQTDNTTRQNSNAKSSLLQNKPKIHKLANVAMSSHRNGERERERGKKKSITKKLLQKPRTTEKKEANKQTTASGSSKQ
jgi:hypothetical protein